MPPRPHPSPPPKLVVMGASRGGLKALEVILEGLPEDFPLPVAVVLHRVAEDDHHLAGLLQGHSSLPVVEAEDKTPLTPGRVYLAPPDYHLLIDEEGLALSNEAPVNYSRPSIDVLFESARIFWAAGSSGCSSPGATPTGPRGCCASSSGAASPWCRTPPRPRPRRCPPRPSPPRPPLKSSNWRRSPPCCGKPPASKIRRWSRRPRRCDVASYAPIIPRNWWAMPTLGGGHRGPPHQTIQD